MSTATEEEGQKEASKDSVRETEMRDNNNNETEREREREKKATTKKEEK